MAYNEPFKEAVKWSGICGGICIAVGTAIFFKTEEYHWLNVAACALVVGLLVCTLAFV